MIESLRGGVTDKSVKLECGTLGSNGRKGFTTFVIQQNARQSMHGCINHRLLSLEIVARQNGASRIHGRLMLYPCICTTDLVRNPSLASITFLNPTFSGCHCRSPLSPTVIYLHNSHCTCTYHLAHDSRQVNSHL